MAANGSRQSPLVTIDKSRLHFFISNEQDNPSSPHSNTSEKLHTTDVLIVTCNYISPVAYKVKTTNHPRYIVRPNAGILRPNESVKILIGVQESKLPDMPQDCKDKFKILAAESETDDSYSSPEFWERMNLPSANVSSGVVRVSFFSADEKPIISSANITPSQITSITGIHPNSSVAPDSTATGLPHVRDLPPNILPRAPQRAPPPVPVPNLDANLIRTDEIPTLEAPADPVPMPETNTLLQEGQYEQAVAKVRELNGLLDAKNLELTQMKTELAEANAEIERILKEAPKTPMSANKVVADPFGGVSIAGFGMMILLFAILVGVILRVF